MRAILKTPAIYQAYQNMSGFFGARVKAIADYLTLRPGLRIIDIGCGPEMKLPVAGSRSIGSVVQTVRNRKRFDIQRWRRRHAP